MTTHHTYEFAQLRHQELLDAAARVRLAHAVAQPRRGSRPFARVLARARSHYDAGRAASSAQHVLRDAV